MMSTLADTSCNDDSCIVDIKNPVFLKNIPRPDTESYLHIIHLNSEYEIPKLQGKLFCHRLLTNDSFVFGIVTQNALPAVCTFPVFPDLGKLSVHIECNARIIYLSRKQLENISQFHRLLFLNILKTIKSCFKYDLSVTGYFIVPVEKDIAGHYKLIEKIIDSDMNTDVSRPDQIRPKINDDENYEYIGAVIAPWYRNCNEPEYSIVTDTKTGVRLNTIMKGLRQTYGKYYQEKYDLKASCSQQLFEVQKLTMPKECIIPRSISVSDKQKQVGKLYLVPQFCSKIPFPGELWYKSLLLPSILHRFHNLLLAEELRRNIVKSSHVGTLNISENLESAEYFKFEIEKKQSSLKNPSLMILKQHSGKVGPSQYHILQAITLKRADDLFNMERAETFGDSFLKYAASLALYFKESKANEGVLTSLRSGIVGNKNLCDCGKRLKISEYIKAHKFVVDEYWYPPGFGIPQHLKKKLPVSPAVLSTLEIPRDEQFSGILSEKTVKAIISAMKKYAQETTITNSIAENIGLFYCDKQRLTNKSVADVVEAIIGVYLENSGIDGAFRLVKYLGILKDDYFEEVMHQTVELPKADIPLNEVSKFDDYLEKIDFEKIEGIFNYRFRDRKYMLEALTHPSYNQNNYQRLEFLGDAVLDFLLTSFIYEHCGTLSPGQLTDLRSSLVNNNLFGALSVRLGLQKYILMSSAGLERAIHSFVVYQNEKNFEICGNEFMRKINKGGTIIAAEIEVPKVLGDLFESIAGAIFLDSNRNLNVVWHIYYNIMKQEIERFIERVPVSPIRALHELSSQLIEEYSEFNTNEQTVKIILQVQSKNKTEKLQVYTGIGMNKVSAKRAAAKLAIKELGYDGYVI